MKLLKNISLVLVVVFLVSCEKHEIQYMTTAASNMAEFQLHNFVPEFVADSNNIYKVEINGELFANDLAPLKSYNAIPSGSVGKFYTASLGANNIKLYKHVYDKATKKLTTDWKLVYDQQVNLTLGKQNIFVHDFKKPPVIFQNGHPYNGNVTEKTDSTAWIKFYNFLYEKTDVPTTLKLQYQYQYPIKYDEKGNVIVKSDWLNVGKPVSFGETTGWIPVVVNKSVLISSGTARLDYKIKVIDETGTDIGELKILNSKNAFVNYSDYWNAVIGRRYHHTISGMRADKPNCAVRVLTGL